MTLIELLVVVAIIGIIATIGFVVINSGADDARDGTRLLELKSLEGAVERYYITNSNFPKPTGGKTCAPVSEIATALGITAPTGPVNNEEYWYLVEYDGATAGTAADKPTDYRLITTLTEGNVALSGDVDGNPTGATGDSLKEQGASGNQAICDCTDTGISTIDKTTAATADQMTSGTNLSKYCLGRDT